MRLAGSQIVLCGFDNFSALDAAGADLHASVAAGRKLNPDGLQIGIKTSSRFVISVRYVVSKLRAFPANVAALCHIYCLPAGDN